MPYLISAILGYFLGCLSPSYMLSKRKDVDLRENGTGKMSGISETAQRSNSVPI